jgi:hypothetical protein
VLRQLPLKHCGALAPYFAKNCVDLRLIQIAEDTGGSIGDKVDVGIYGLVKEPASEELYVAPLVNFDNVNDALNYLGGLDDANLYLKAWIGVHWPEKDTWKSHRTGVDVSPSSS